MCHSQEMLTNDLLDALNVEIKRVLTIKENFKNKLFHEVDSKHNRTQQNGNRFTKFT